MRIPTLSLSAFAFIFLFSQAHSSPINYERRDIISSTLESGIIGSSGITDSFSMDVSFRKNCLGIPISYNCNWSFNTRIYDDTGTHLKFEFTDLVSTGAGLCGSVDGGVSPQPWLGTISHADLPTSDIDFSTISSLALSNIFIQTSCGSCEGSLAANYYNLPSGGEIPMAGSLPNSPSIPTGHCALSGVLRSGIYEYAIWH